MEKQAGLGKGLLTGLLGIGDITAENIARQAGKGVRRSAAPVAAAGGTAALVNKKDKENKMEKSAFWAGFHKEALDLRGARAAVDGIKKNIIRRGLKIKDSFVKDPYQDGSMMSLSKKTDRKFGPAVIAHPSAISHPAADRKIFAKGDMTNFMAKNKFPQPKMDKQNREMTNRVTLLHEQAERNAYSKTKKKDRTTWTGGHAHPRVILQENNMLATMPKGFEGTKETFKNLRNADQSAPAVGLGVKGYEHGEKRYSRHAIKHISNRIEEKGAGPVKINDVLEPFMKAKAERKAIRNTLLEKRKSKETRSGGSLHGPFKKAQ